MQNNGSGNCEPPSVFFPLSSETYQPLSMFSFDSTDFLGNGIFPFQLDPCKRTAQSALTFGDKPQRTSILLCILLSGRAFFSSASRMAVAMVQLVQEPIIWITQFKLFELEGSLVDR